MPKSGAAIECRTVCAAIKIVAFALAVALPFAAGPASAQLALSIQNRVCGPVLVELPGAPLCGPEGRICATEARAGYTTRLLVDRGLNENYLRLVLRGECPQRNIKLAGECVVKVRKIDRIESEVRPLGQPPGYDFRAVQAPATLISIEIVQGICDDGGGERRCELTCRSRDQQ